MYFDPKNEKKNYIHNGFLCKLTYLLFFYSLSSPFVYSMFTRIFLHIYPIFYLYRNAKYTTEYKDI